MPCKHIHTCFATSTYCHAVYGLCYISTLMVCSSNRLQKKFLCTEKKCSFGPYTTSLFIFSAWCVAFVAAGLLPYCVNGVSSINWEWAVREQMASTIRYSVYFRAIPPLKDCRYTHHPIAGILAYFMHCLIRTNTTHIGISCGFLSNRSRTIKKKKKKKSGQRAGPNHTTV